MPLKNCMSMLKSYGMRSANAITASLRASSTAGPRVSMFYRSILEAQRVTSGQLGPLGRTMGLRARAIGAVTISTLLLRTQPATYLVRGIGDRNGGMSEEHPRLSRKTTKKIKDGFLFCKTKGSMNGVEMGNLVGIENAIVVGDYGTILFMG